MINKDELQRQAFDDYAAAVKELVRMVNDSAERIVKDSLLIAERDALIASLKAQLLDAQGEIARLRAQLQTRADTVLPL